MLRKRIDRRASGDFIQALLDQSRNHAFERIEFLAAELDELGRLFESKNSGLVIKGEWVAANLSYAFTMSYEIDGTTSLLRMMLTPVGEPNGRKDVMAHFAYDDIDHVVGGPAAFSRVIKTFHRLDVQRNADKMMDAVRVAIIASVPSRYRAHVEEILHDPLNLTGGITLDQLRGKYAGSQNLVGAYVDAHASVAPK